jgi:hypothetical protein
MNFRGISLLVLTATLLPICSYAQVNPIETCTLSGTIHLTAYTQIFCAHDMQVEAHTQIVTHGYNLQIAAVGSLVLPPRTDGGLSIISFAANEAPGANSEAGTVSVSARTAYGYLQIRNSGPSADDLAGSVSIEYLATKDYDQDISVPEYTPVNLRRGGHIDKACGSTYKFPSHE